MFSIMVERLTQLFYTSREALGVESITEPKARGHEYRCYIKDPDGCYLIEVGEAKRGYSQRFVEPLINKNGNPDQMLAGENSHARCRL